MNTKDMLLAVRKAQDDLYVDDVFASTPYTGNGSSQTLINDIDLLEDGGAVWIKSVDETENHALYSSATPGKYLEVNTTAPMFSDAGFSFNSNGFEFSSGSANRNGVGDNYSGWAFKRSRRFFDVVTYIGDGFHLRAISHNLGVVPGFVVVTRVDGSQDNDVAVRQSSGQWMRSDSAALMALNSNGSSVNEYDLEGLGYMTDSEFVPQAITQGNIPRSNASGVQYVAYLFAHDPSDDGIIQAGTFVSSSGSTVSVDLGWEPQWLLVKNLSGNASWNIFDRMLGWANPGSGVVSAVVPNSNSTSSLGLTGYAVPTPNGFTTNASGSSQKHFYLAIRRSNKIPTDVQKVFGINTGTAGGDTLGSNLLVSTTQGDLGILVNYESDEYMAVADNIRGINRSATSTYLPGPNRPTPILRIGKGTGALEENSAIYVRKGISGYQDHLAYRESGTAPRLGIRFYRARGFFDMVDAVGTGSGTSSISHGLGVLPELTIAKRMDGLGSWTVTLFDGSQTRRSYLDTPNAFSVLPGNLATDSTFDASHVFGNVAARHIVYLFASCPGISKIGTYLGNGGTQTIDCGFSGSTWMLIVKNRSTGNWHLVDARRGWAPTSSGNAKSLVLNSGLAHIDLQGVQNHSTGFKVTGQMNAQSNNYIYFAVAYPT